MATHTYLCMLAEDSPVVALAAIPASDGAAGVPAMARTQLPGLFYDVWIPRFPTSTVNSAPDLRGSQVVKKT